jgi:hypothetical protein
MIQLHVKASKVSAVHSIDEVAKIRVLEVSPGPRAFTLIDSAWQQVRRGPEPEKPAAQRAHS